MANFIINHVVNGYTNVEINDDRLVEGTGNNVVVVLDATTSDKLIEYYDSIVNILLSNNKLFLLIIGKESQIRNSICALVANYRNYNIYKVDSKGTIDSEYLEAILEREPSIDEVQQFIGGDISSYSNINMILIGINDFVSRGDLDGLKMFIESNVHSIDNMVSVIEYMKKIVDVTNSSELMDKIDELKAKIKVMDNKCDMLEAENDKVKEDNLRLSEKNSENAKEISKLLAKSKEMEKQVAESTGPVIQSYSELNTALIKCNVLNIMYFKEISYVPYTNTLIYMLVERLKMTKRKVKLIIYDSNCGLSQVYKPMSVISGNDFVANKFNFISQVEAFVVAEPNPVILTSILESVNPVFDVVIIYDRMKQLNNIVIGNNVVNFFVINSSSNFKETQKILKINDKSSVITRAGSSIGPETLNIPTIPNFHEGSQSRRQSGYTNLKCEGNNKPLIQTLLSKARINSSMNR